MAQPHLTDSSPCGRPGAKDPRAARNSLRVPAPAGAEPTTVLVGVLAAVQVGSAGWLLSVLVAIRLTHEESFRAARAQFDSKLAALATLASFVTCAWLVRTSSHRTSTPAIRVHRPRYRESSRTLGLWVDRHLDSALPFLTTLLVAAVRMNECLIAVRGGLKNPVESVYLLGACLHLLVLVALLASLAMMRPRRSATLALHHRAALLAHAAWLVSILLWIPLHADPTVVLGAGSTWLVLLLGAFVLLAASGLALLLHRASHLGVALMGAATGTAAFGGALMLETVRSDIWTDPAEHDRPAEITRPFEGTRRQAQVMAEVGNLGDVRAVLAATFAAPPLVPKKVRRTPPVAPDTMEKAKATYDIRCASCHGSNGKGDGPGAFAIKPAPRDYTDAAWQASVTDEELTKSITQGGAAVGKSYMMPPSPDLRGKSDIVAGLVELVRSFGEKQR